MFDDLKYGSLDCLTLAFSILDAAGLDHPQLPKYTTAAGGIRAMKKAGFNNLVEVVDSLGLQRIGAAQVLPADLVAIRADSFGGYALGCVVGPDKIMAFIEHDGRIFCDTGSLLDVCVALVDDPDGVVAWRLV